MKRLIDQLYNDNHLSTDDLHALITHVSANQADRDYLFNRAYQTKQRYYGDTVFLRGLIEISSYCTQSCLYCGIRAQNNQAARYRLSDRQILDCVDEGHRLGFNTFVLQGGEDPHFSDTRVSGLVKLIKSRYPNSAITLSLGEKSLETYRLFKQAGVDRYLLRHETANRALYTVMHPQMSYDNRRRCLNDIKAVGMQTGAGFLVGLPNQTTAHYVEDLLFLKTLQPAMIGIGPFMPHDKTPLKNQPAGNVDTVLIMLALTRLLLPKVLLPSTTALGSVDPIGREKALLLGANVLMPNLSPGDYRAHYEIYQNKVFSGIEAAQSKALLIEKVEAIGLSVDMGRGDHVDWR